MSDESTGTTVYTHTHSTKIPNSFYGLALPKEDWRMEGLKQAYIAEYKAFYQRELRLNRKLLGNEMAKREAEIDAALEDAPLQYYMATISFPDAKEDPNWYPVEGKYRNPSIFKRMRQVSNHKCWGHFEWCYEWKPNTRILHVHIYFTWLWNGDTGSILDRLKNIFYKYISAEQDVHLKKWDESGRQYLLKNPTVFKEKAEKNKISKVLRKKYKLDDIYQRVIHVQCDQGSGFTTLKN